MYSSPLQFSLEEWKGFAMEEKRAEKGISGSNSQRGCKILGQRGDIEMGRVSLILCFLLEWDPKTFFYRPKEIVMVGMTGYGRSTG
jgi:hypothetical protein